MSRRAAQQPGATVAISVRITPAVRDRLELAARLSGRTRSAQVAGILHDALPEIPERL